MYLEKQNTEDKKMCQTSKVKQNITSLKNWQSKHLLSLQGKKNDKEPQVSSSFYDEKTLVLSVSSITGQLPEHPKLPEEDLSQYQYWPSLQKLFYYINRMLD